MLDALGLTPGTPTPPIPPGHDGERWEEQRRRWRMLYGRWLPDLISRRAALVGNVRAKAWGVPDLSSNMLRATADAQSNLYAIPPTVTNSDQSAEQFLAPEGPLARSGWGRLMRRVQRDTIAIRETFLRVDASRDPRSGKVEVSWRIVHPHMVLATPDPDRPNHAMALAELRPRVHPETGKVAWFWDVFNLSPVPSYRVIEAIRFGDPDAVAVDRSLHFLGVEGGLVGDAYPYTWSDGRPFLPYPLYHAAATGQLFDPFDRIELVEGSLNAASLVSMLLHVSRAASWPQRYLLGARLAGAKPIGNGPAARTQATADPAVVMELEQTGDKDGKVEIGQWAPAIEIDKFAGTVWDYERRVAALSGLRASDVHRVSGDPRSGYSIELTRAAEREQAASYRPQFRPTDQEAIAMAARLWTLAGGGAAPESGYYVDYHLPPPSASEQTAQREHLLELMRAGLTDPISVWLQLNPGRTEQDARAALEQNRILNLQYSGQVQAA